jgi:hypothetical protein
MNTKNALAAAGCIVVLTLPTHAAAEKDLKFFPIKSFTVHGEIHGMNEGKYTEHVNRHGGIRVEINKSKMNMMGMKMNTNEKVITEGPWVTRVDLDRRTASRIRNPMYDNIKKSVQEKGGLEAAKAYIRGLGGRETNRTGKYAGEKCRYWEIPPLGANWCVTPDGITVWADVNMGGMKMTRVAIRVKRNDAGPSSAYKVDPGIKITEGPALPAGQPGSKGFDMNKMMKDMFKQGDN